MSYIAAHHRLRVQLSARLLSALLEEALDCRVYRPGGGLRMMGSQKVKNGNVVGRVYRVAAVVDARGGVWEETELERWAADTPSVLAQISMHIL